MRASVVLPDYGHKMRHWAKNAGQKAIAKKACPRPWVAIKLCDKLEFIEGFTDLSASNPDGSAGIIVRFFLEVGSEYLFSEPQPKGGARVFLGKVLANGAIEETSRN